MKDDLTVREILMLAKKHNVELPDWFPKYANAIYVRFDNGINAWFYDCDFRTEKSLKQLEKLNKLIVDKKVGIC